MSKFKCALIVVLCHCPFVHRAAADLISMEGDLDAVLNGVPIPGRNTNSFLEPTQVELDQWRQAITLLLQRDYAAAAQLADPLLYDVIEFADTVTDKVYYILLEQQFQGQPFRGLGTFVYNPQSCRLLNLQAPHAFISDDSWTREEIVDLFIQLQATFMQFAGTSRCANIDECSPCSGTTSTCSSGSCCSPQDNAGCSDSTCQDAICATDPFCCDTEWDNICVLDAQNSDACNCPGGCGPGSNYWVSDVAHYENNFYHHASIAVAELIPELVSVSVHGFSPTCGCSNPPPGCPSGQPEQTSMAAISNVTSIDQQGSLATQLTQAINNILSGLNLPAGVQLAGSCNAVAALGEPDVVWPHCGPVFCGQTNVQGRQIHGSPDVCNTSVMVFPSPERFLHMEQQPALRRDPDDPDNFVYPGVSWQVVADAFATVFPCQSCGPSAGNCYEDNGTPGCAVPECCAAVCAVDPFCCDTHWDSVCGGEAFAQCGPPQNYCAYATAEFESSIPFNNTNATTDGPPHDACDDGGGDTQIENDLWFKVQSTCIGTLTISTCNDANFDTKLALYDYDSECPVQEDDLLACNDDAAGCSNGTSQISFFPALDALYLVRVGGAGGATGPGTLSVSCQPICGEGAGSCFEQNGSPGCDDFDCCQTMCGVDPFCCDVMWDDLCAEQALGVCYNCGPDSGDCLEVHAGTGCDITACCSAVCQEDIFCCDGNWDQICVDLAQQACASCGGAGAGDCFESNPTTACSDQFCCDLICSVDPFCCTRLWDTLCAEEANGICTVCGQPNTGDCFTENGTPGCNNTECCSQVCVENPDCCVAVWDQSCADIAAALCEQPCPADTNGDGTVDIQDLLNVISDWGTCVGCPTDIDNNGEVDIVDLLAVISDWGPC